MRAGDVKCPECGTGFRDVSPGAGIGDYEIPGSIGRVHNASVSGHCQNGHMLIAGARTRADGTVGIEVWRFDSDGKRLP